MFERFLEAFGGATSVGEGVSVELGLAAFGGQSFAGGLYRVHSAESSRQANEWVRQGFAEFAGRFSCFGFDWLGRQFATDAARGSAADPEVMMLEPGSGEALEIPVPLSVFHDEELVDYAEEALARSFFEKWLAAGGAAPGFSECVGYRRPLFWVGMMTSATWKSPTWTCTGL